jgi:small subunit ribosomal protein S21
MRKYNRNNDVNSGQYGNAQRPKRNNSDWMNGPPPNLTPYQHSAWLLSTFNGMKVELREGEPIDSLLRRFKKMVEFSGLMHEIKKRECHLSPCQKKRVKKARAKKRRKDEQKKWDSENPPFLDHEEVKPTVL